MALNFLYTYCFPPYYFTLTTNFHTKQNNSTEVSDDFGYEDDEEDDDDEAEGLTGVKVEMLDASGAPMGDSEANIKIAVDTKREMNGIKVRFEGYSDVAKSRSAFSRFSSGETTSIDSGEIRIRYRANGTVRPYKLFLSDADGNVQIVEVNSVGTGKSYKED